MRALAVGLACALIGVAATAAAALKPAPSSLRFSNLATGVEVDRDVTVTNLSAAAVTINSATITMGAGPYAIKTAPPFPAVLQPNASVTLTIKFTAAMFGETDGELTVASTDADTPMLKVPLFGGAGAPALTLSPVVVIFSPTTVGTTSALQMVTVANSGFSDLIVNDPTLEIDDAGPQDFAIDAAGLVKTIPFGQASAFRVQFKPMSVGQKYATVEMTTANGGGTQDVALSGVSVAPLVFDLSMPVVPGGDLSAAVSMDMAAGGGNPLSDQKNGCSCQLGGGPAPSAAPLALVALALVVRLRGRGPAGRRGR